MITEIKITIDQKIASEETYRGAVIALIELLKVLEEHGTDPVSGKKAITSTVDEIK